MLRITNAILAFALIWPGAAAADGLKARFENPTDREYLVELRDMVCEGKVLWSGRMKPGTSQSLHICAGADGLGAVAATVAGGCASAETTIFEGLDAGQVIAVAGTE